MIESNKQVTWVTFGTGDIAHCGMIRNNDCEQQFYVFQQHVEGEIGYEHDLDREFPIQDGWVAGQDEPCVAFQFGKVESLDSVIDGLIEHRALRFPDAEPRK